MIRYCLPLAISLVYITLAELGYFYAILPVLLVANLLNAYWGEFSEQDMKQEMRRFYGSGTSVLIKRLSAVAFLGMIVWGVIFVARQNLSWSYVLSFAFCTGCLTGCFMVTLAHDMLHSRAKGDHVLSSALLIASGIPHLAGDHIFGHHRNIGLKYDTTTAKLNQDFYRYFVRLSFTQVKRSFFTKHNIPQYMRRRILLTSLARTMVWLSACAAIVVFCDHALKCLLFFLMQGWIAYILYELINYIQHYGLTRTEKKQPVTQGHSWNCYYKYTNYILFMLPVHSLHHLPAGSRHVKEKDLLNGPRMPYLYFVMIGMALVPPVWFRKMNPLSMQYNRINEA